MAIIPDFPNVLVDLHHHWHSPSDHPGSGPGRVHAAGTPGGGLEFFTFHHDFMEQVFDWVNEPALGGAGRFDPPLDLTPWTEIPAELKVAATSWNMMLAMQETRIISDSPAFTSEDDLGTFIELGIHSWIHGATATIFHEPVVASLHSPQSTYFYQIHGLVDQWWNVWVKAHRTVLSVVDISRLKHILDNIIIRPDLKPIIDIPHKPIKEKDKDKDSFENPEFPGFEGDPVFQIGQLTRRIQRLEVQAAAARAFIRPVERPQVGAHLRDDSVAEDDNEAQPE